MLVLTRRNQSAIILHTSDGPITVRVVGFRGTSVRLGVEAPVSVKVLREELIRHEYAGAGVDIGLCEECQRP